MVPGRYPSVPSARLPISQTQQASSRATATLATLARLPAALSAPWRRESLAVASSALPLIRGGTSWPAGAAFGLGEHDA